MTPKILARLRTAVTLGVLALLLLLGVSWAWGALTDPFPREAKPPICVDEKVAAGDTVRPGGVTISVLNAGTREGLAGRTLDALVDGGFARGRLSNAPDDVKVGGAQIWAPDDRDPAVLLLKSYLGGKGVKVLERKAPEPGINVLVGDKFPGVTKGRQKIVAKHDATICAPPDLT